MVDKSNRPLVEFEHIPKTNANRPLVEFEHKQNPTKIKQSRRRRCLHQVPGRRISVQAPRNSGWICPTNVSLQNSLDLIDSGDDSGCNGDDEHWLSPIVVREQHIACAQCVPEDHQATGTFTRIAPSHHVCCSCVDMKAPCNMSRDSFRCEPLPGATQRSLTTKRFNVMNKLKVHKER